MLACEAWNCWALPWKVDWTPSGRAAVSSSRSLEHLAERDPGLDIKGKGNRRQLAGVVDRQGADTLLQPDHRGQRHQAALVRADMELLQGLGVGLVARLQFHDHAVLVVGAIDRRDRPVAVGS